MKDRRFGVEIEFNSDGRGPTGVANELGRAFDKAGIRRWYFRDRIYYDGSELELATPILRGKDGFDKLKLVMDTLNEIGCYADIDADGLHVHHDAPEFCNSIDLCLRLVKNWRSNSHLIYQFVDPYRHRNGEGYGHWACPKWSDEEVAEMERQREVPYWERHDLNLGALSKHGTVEIRLHEGTLDFDEASSWIKFGQKFLNHTVKHSMNETKDATALLKKVKVSPNDARLLERKRNALRNF